MSVSSGPDEAWFLPRTNRQPARVGQPNPCRKKRRLKKRDYKSASVATPSGTSGRSTGARSINSASSVFPTSTPGNSPVSSRTPSRATSGQSDRATLVEGQRGEVAGDGGDGRISRESLGFDPVYSKDYEVKKERLLKGKFSKLLHNYFPDRIHSQKMSIPEGNEVKDSDYDTDLDIDLGLELLADEKARRCKEDGVCAEYKQLCRKYDVVPNSYFIRHVMDDYMRIRYRYFSYGDSASLSHEIQNQPSVTKLDLSDNAMGPAGMLCFAQMLKSNAYITEANFANNNVGVFGARLMKFILVKNVRLTMLDMSGNKFGLRGSRYCAIAINVNTTLKELYIANNGLSDDGATQIGKALANNQGLEVLDLSWNHIGRKGAQGLAKGLKLNSSLKVLALRMNGCHEDGSKALFGALRYNDTLEEIDLSSNRVGDETAKVLSKALPYLRLKTINLALNPLSSESTERILKVMLAMEEVPLCKLDLEGVIVSDDFQLLAEELGCRNVSIRYAIPPSSRERSRDIPLETLSRVINFLDDVEMDPAILFPEPGGGELIMTVEDLFKQMEKSGMFMDKSRLFKMKQECHRDFRRRFLLKDLFLINSGRRQSLMEALTTAQAVDNLDLSQSTEALNTERSNFSVDTFST